MRGFSDRDIKLVNWLFTELQSIYPAWSKAFPDDHSLKAAKRTWTIALVEQGVSDINELKAALRVARADESAFFPSVGKFISWGKSESDMKAREAFNLLNVYRGGQMHTLPVEVRASFDQLRHVDFQKTEQDLFTIFKGHYHNVLELKKQGKTLDHLIVPRLSDPNEGRLISDEQRVRIYSKIQDAKRKLFSADTDD